MKPGATTSPSASTVRAAFPEIFLPTDTIFPEATPTSARIAGAPVPSTSRPFLIRTSRAIRASYASGRGGLPRLPHAPGVDGGERDEAADAEREVAVDELVRGPAVVVHQLGRVREVAAFVLAERDAAEVPARRHPGAEHVDEGGGADGEEAPAQRALVELRALAEEEARHQQAREHHAEAVAAERDQHLRGLGLDSQRADPLQQEHRAAQADEQVLLRLPGAEHHESHPAR